MPRIALNVLDIKLYIKLYKINLEANMKEREANTDTTYCTNKKCKFKNICERSIDHYNFNTESLYWFCEFDELECEKRRINEL